MTLTAPRRVDRREALVASSLVAGVFIVVGYATGLGITTTSSAAGAAIAPPVPQAPAINYVVPPGPDMSLVPGDTAPLISQVVASLGPTIATASSGAPTMGSRPSGSSAAGSNTARRSSCHGVSAAEQTLLQHVFVAHLGESPAQQLAAILNADQYAKSHTTLASSLLQSVIGGVTGAEDTLLQHVEAGHLGESPSQQLSDILNADQYIKTHTALTSSMLQSIIGAC